MYSTNTVVSLNFVGDNYRQFQQLRCFLTFEFDVMILANYFSWYLSLWFCTTFHGLTETTKTTKIGVQRI